MADRAKPGMSTSSFWDRVQASRSTNATQGGVHHPSLSDGNAKGRERSGRLPKDVRQDAQEAARDLGVAIHVFRLKGEQYRGVTDDDPGNLSRYRKIGTLITVVHPPKGVTIPRDIHNKAQKMARQRGVAIVVFRTPSGEYRGVTADDEQRLSQFRASARELGTVEVPQQSRKPATPKPIKAKPVKQKPAKQEPAREQPLEPEVAMRKPRQRKPRKTASTRRASDKLPVALPAESTAGSDEPVPAIPAVASETKPPKQNQLRPKKPRKPRTMPQVQPVPEQEMPPASGLPSSPQPDQDDEDLASRGQQALDGMKNVEALLQILVNQQ